ncbi:glycoside hydrolase family 43 protein [Fibrella aquatilis]|uniref:Glycoside hydrolase family 43 protein n=1 Tax=Fibrella aquatilis TaxID=2817059 RepID=A0A939JXW3_9BACT|nr:glycoside hydrolase family 43 protein [Fibrella aquatilis]MBO0931449.1 glycoside hydrolase family 43 protein [Fibrella aquatilis]
MKNSLFSSLILLVFLGGYGCKKTPDPVTPMPPVVVVDTVGKFSNPILPVGPDPWVVANGGFYYVMHTTGNSLRIYKTASMSRLSAARPVTVWTPPATGPNSRNIWAPELHLLNGKWYIYYAADDGNDKNHRMFVLENAAADPTTGTWTDRGQLMLADNKWAIDATVLNLNNQLYCAWSGWENDLGGPQAIYISKLINSYTAEGPRVRLSFPDYAWEKQGFGVNEGPEFLVNGGKVFLVYSASFCGTDFYALGQLTASSTANLTDAAAWTKSANPVFGPYGSSGTYGVGHNSFFQTPNGKENWIVYHANAAPGQGCGDNRSVRMQPFTFNTDGTPNFGQPVPLSQVLKRPSGE